MIRAALKGCMSGFPMTTRHCSLVVLDTICWSFIVDYG